MSRKGTVASVISSAAIFIILEIAAFGLLSHSSSLQDMWLERISYKIRLTLWRSGESVRNYFLLEKQNHDLSEKNHYLTEQLVSLNGKLLSKESDSLMINAGSDFKCIPAIIVKMSRNVQRNYFILDKGRNDGVEPLSGVITAKGVVGIISSVGENYSYGLTLMNPEINVSSRIGRNGIVASMVWDGKHSNKAELVEVPSYSPTERGDTLWTSGFSSIFPPDIPLGIIGEYKVIGNTNKQVDVDLFEDFSVVRFVTIVRNTSKEEIENLEFDNEKGGLPL